MKIKKLLFFFIPIFFLSTLSFSTTINIIKVEGNKRISKESIIVLSGISENNTIDLEDLNNSLKQLYQTDFFSDIKLDINQDLLTIKVVENPIIENISLTGIKKKSIEELILSSINLRSRKSYVENIFKSDLNLIENILKTNGFYFSNIKSTLTKNEQLNSVDINIDIDLGKKAKIKEIIFLGDKKIKDKKLLEIISSEEHKFWKFISRKVYINKSLIDLDIRLLENFYKNNGYYNVKVLDSFAEIDNKDSFKLIFNIEAGDKYFFNDFILEIPDDYKKDSFKSIEKIFSDLKNKPYSLDNLNLILEEIDYIASLKLYDFLNAEVSEQIIENNKLNFKFTITNSEKFYVNRINILGNFNTIEEVIRNNLIVDEGDPLNQLLFNKSINNIKALGIFKSVNTKIENTNENSKKDIIINVEEKPTGEISLGAGVGTSGTVFGGGITEKNFLGKGINLDTNFEISQKGLKGSFIYSKPNFAYTDNTLFTSVKSTSEDNLTDFGYKISEVGFSIGTKFEQFENLFFSPELDFTIEDLETNSKVSSNLKKQEGSYTDFYFNYNLDYDLRNSSFNPTSGSRTTFYQEFPVSSDNYELINTFVHTKYKLLNQNSDMIGKASLYFKNINSLNNSDSRISKRVSLPYNRLRGFEKGKIGPLDNSDYIGGNYAAAINLSTNLPAIFNTVENIDFTYFIDLANVWGVDYDSSLDDASAIRSSTGIGLDFITPIGPLSFSLTQPITKKSTDQTETFRFNLGTTF